MPRRPCKFMAPVVPFTETTYGPLIPPPPPPPVILTSTFFPLRVTVTPEPVKLMSFTDLIICALLNWIPTAPPPSEVKSNVPLLTDDNFSINFSIFLESNSS